MALLSVALVALISVNTLAAIDTASGHLEQKQAYWLSDFIPVEAVFSSPSEEHWYVIHKSYGELYLNYIAANVNRTRLRLTVFDLQGNIYFGELLDSCQASGRTLPIATNAVGDYLLKVQVDQWDGRMTYVIEMHSMTSWDCSTREEEPNDTAGLAKRLCFPEHQRRCSTFHSGQLAWEGNRDYWAYRYYSRLQKSV